MNGHIVDLLLRINPIYIYGYTIQANMDRVNILGTQIHALNLQSCLCIIKGWIRDSRRDYVSVVPAHSIMDARADLNFQKVLNHSGLATPDGMAIVWILKARGHSEVSRVYGPELLLELCERGVEQNYRHFFYGGRKEELTGLVQTLNHQFPGISIVGSYSPPFRPLTESEDIDVVRIINDSSADIVWVGIGSPKQEYWMAEHLGKIEAPAMIGVGAAFDFLSGNKAQAPHWIQRSGLEWLFRLSSEPKRLWPRYRQYPLFMWLVMLQLLGLREFPLE